MKKISTLSFGILFSLASFANGGHDHANTAGTATIKLRFDVNRFDRHPMSGREQVTVPLARGTYNGREWVANNNGDDYRYNHNGHGYTGNDRNMQYNDYGRNHTYYNSNDNRAISSQDFFAAERVLDRENDNGRLLYAKRIMDDNYLSAEQVMELARFFSFDNCRLDFARYAYSKTLDKDNFSVVCNAFSSSEGRGQLMNFTRNCR